MTARTVMVLGTASSVGKSLIAAALCRLLAREGLRVAPFKAQNMSNNAAALPDGREIGRAQFLQALAARTEARVEMNPVLLKPESDRKSLVVVMGRPSATLAAADYYGRKAALWKVVTEACATLEREYDFIVAEGAGSPAEINLASSDIVNMAVARHLDAPALLVADIDPGGVFAQVAGTLALLPEEDRRRIKGVIINKFRGDIALFEPGVRMLEELTGVPVLGVIPMLKDLDLPDEDGATIVTGTAAAAQDRGGSFGPAVRLDITVIRLPHIANFDDFDALSAEPGVSLRFVERPGDLGRPDVLILPGTKATLHDLAWLKEQGFDDGIRWLSRTGTSVTGICGGFQVLGDRISDPAGVEGGGEAEGLGLLRTETIFAGEKKVGPVRGTVAGNVAGTLASAAGLPVEGYEIHSGVTECREEPFAYLELQADGIGGTSAEGAQPDGAVSPDGRVWGTYVHDVFSSDAFRRAWLSGFGVEACAAERKVSIDRAIDRLADAVRDSLDMDRLGKIIGVQFQGDF
jgi:adenosylcobyric acid synthase